MTFKSNFSDAGLEVGQDNTSLTYLYGLSDFFATMFEDTSSLNLLLEATSFNASEVYSKFLQLATSLSLDQVQEVSHSSTKLVLLTADNLVSGTESKYILPEKIVTAKFLANRPFLPTELLDEGVDYLIEQAEDGSCFIHLAKNIQEYSFPRRLLPSGEEQFAIWLSDVTLDEQFVSKFYGNLIGVSPEAASKRFADFVYGLYYVYTHGPKLEVISRGLNLVLGIPLAREMEEVLDIRIYLETDQYIVICDQNQYLIPYGIMPSVRVGDVLSVGQSLAEWVEVRDYQKYGDWWINLQIPSRVIPEIPAGQKDRHATAGSHFDYLMRNYLKKNTFLVRINVTTFKNIQQFVDISKVIREAKPTWTQPIYVWVIPVTDVINLRDVTAISLAAKWSDSLNPDILRLRRDNLTDPIVRGKQSFIRYNAAAIINPIVGRSNYTSEYQGTLGSGQVTGFINQVSTIRENTGLEKAWLKTLMTRGARPRKDDRSKIGHFRGSNSTDGLGIQPSQLRWEVQPNTLLIPLYTTVVKEMDDKRQSIGYPPLEDYEWVFDIFNSSRSSRAINSAAVNEGYPYFNEYSLRDSYEEFCYRSYSQYGFSREFNKHSLTTWAPIKTDLSSQDYLLCIRITKAVVGVYLVTSNKDIKFPAYFSTNSIDPLLIKGDMPISRGLASTGSPFYFSRGMRSPTYSALEPVINGTDIDGDTGTGELISQPTYSDKYNNSVNIDRSGSKITQAMESF